MNRKEPMRKTAFVYTPNWEFVDRRTRKFFKPRTLRKVKRITSKRRRQAEKRKIKKEI